MSKVLQNKIDFALVFTVKNANPNGDPLNGNRPRQNFDGLGEVSDVCLKRKIRNRLLSMYVESDESQKAGYEVFVQSDDYCVDGAKSLKERFENAKLSGKNKDEIAKAACEKWLDVRSFGQVFAYKSGKKDGDSEGADAVSNGVRGPVTIQSAFSVEPITITSMQITKSVSGETTKDGKKASDTMGQKHRVDNAVYITYGAINTQLAEKTGFSDEDALKIKEALISLFDNDASSARPEGSMEVLKVVWVKHNSKIGQYSSAKVHKSITANPDGSITIDKLPDLSYEELDGK